MYVGMFQIETEIYIKALFFFTSQLISLMKSLHLLVEKHKYHYLILAWNTHKNINYV